ncbi:MAG: hypothetical protein K2G14_06915, partial [Ruminococcus sp.]|nr:hypothetical protein [Ruminococcus sp.]
QLVRSVCRRISVVPVLVLKYIRSGNSAEWFPYQELLVDYIDFLSLVTALISRRFEKEKKAVMSTFIRLSIR